MKILNEKNKMSRRDALKCMGAIVIGGAVASSGLLSLASCAEKKKKRIILYFGSPDIVRGKPYPNINDTR